MNPHIPEKGELTKVRDFMEANDQTVRYRPITELAEWEKVLRVRLILEEAFELAEAMNIEVLGRDRITFVMKDRAINPVATLDALTDLLYVVFGTYHTTGLSKCAKPAFDEVHNSNMSKLGPDGRPMKNEHGKVMKGPEYRPADLRPIVDHFTKPIFVDDSDERDITTNE